MAEQPEIDNHYDSILLHLELDRFIYIQALIYSISHSRSQRNSAVDLSVARIRHLISEVGKDRAMEEFDLAFKNKYCLADLADQARIVNKSEAAHNLTWSRWRNVVFKTLDWDIPIDEVATPGSPVRVTTGKYKGQKGVFESRTPKMVNVRLASDIQVQIRSSSIELDGQPEETSYPFNSLVSRNASLGETATIQQHTRAFPFLNALCSEPLPYDPDCPVSTNCNKCNECLMRIANEETLVLLKDNGKLERK